MYVFYEYLDLTVLLLDILTDHIIILHLRVQLFGESSNLTVLLSHIHTDHTNN